MWGHFRYMLVNITLDHCEPRTAHPPVCIGIPTMFSVTYLNIMVYLWMFSVIPLESDWNKMIFKLYCYLSLPSTIVLNVFKVEKETKKIRFSWSKNSNRKFPEFPIRRKILPRVPHKAQILKWWHPLPIETIHSISCIYTVNLSIYA